MILIYKGGGYHFYQFVFICFRVQKYEELTPQEYYNTTVQVGAPLSKLLNKHFFKRHRLSSIF